jgi:hypothetical protein
MSAGCEVPEEVCTLPLFLCVPGDTMTVCMCKGEAESFKSSKVTKLDTWAVKHAVFLESSLPGAPYRVNGEVTENTDCCHIILKMATVT